MKHKYKGKLFHINVSTTPSSNNDDADTDHRDTDDAVCDTVVVTGDISNEDIVLSYFEGRRSGGNKSKDVESVKIIKKGVFHVKFSDPEGN